MKRALGIAFVALATILCGLPFAGCGALPAPEDTTKAKLVNWNGETWSGVQRFVPAPLAFAAGFMRPEDANSLGGPSGHYITAVNLNSSAQGDVVRVGIMTNVVNSVRWQTPVAEWNGNRVGFANCPIVDTHLYALILQQGGTVTSPSSNVTATIIDVSTFANPCIVTLSRPGGGVPVFNSVLCSVTKDAPHPVGRFQAFSITSCSASTWIGTTVEPNTGSDTALLGMTSNVGGFHFIINTEISPAGGVVTFIWRDDV